MDINSFFADYQTVMQELIRVTELYVNIIYREEVDIHDYAIVSDNGKTILLYSPYYGDNIEIKPEWLFNDNVQKLIEQNHIINTLIKET